MDTKSGPLSNLANALGDAPIDVFIGSASFEARCLSVLRQLTEVSLPLAVIAKNTTYDEAIAANLTTMRNQLNGRVEELTVSSDDPVVSAEKITTVLDDVVTGEPKRILFDITTFTRETLLMLLFFLAGKLRTFDSVRFVYTNAKEYSVGDAPEGKWLSKGIREVRSVIGYPGQMSPTLPTHLIVLVGFEYERALELARLCEPSAVSLGISDGTEHGAAPHLPTNQRIQEELRRKLRRNLTHVDTFVFKTYDADATRKALLRQSQVRTNFNTVIAPLNTKISTVGAGLLAIQDHTIQLCYAPANLYNVNKYSAPGDDYYLYSPEKFPWTEAGLKHLDS